MNSTDYEHLNRVRERIYQELESLGYTPKRNGGPYLPGEDIHKCSAQFRLRDKTQKPKSMTEVEWALCEAICLEGGYVVFPGDGIGCAAQMVWAQHERAEDWEAYAKALEAKNDQDAIEIKDLRWSLAQQEALENDQVKLIMELKDENEKLKKAIRKTLKQLELFGRF